MSAVEDVMPRFAPLHPSLVLYLLEGRRRQARKGVKFSPHTLLEQESGYAEAAWAALEQDVRALRPALFGMLDPLVRSHALSTAWFQQATSRAWLLEALTRSPLAFVSRNDADVTKLPGDAVTSATLTDWRKRGLLHYETRDRPAIHSVAPILLARAVDKRENRFLPATQAEPSHWLCFRQDAPGLSPRPCSLLPSEDVPASAILWTPWTGAVWDGGWMRINTSGAIRFAGVVQDAQQLRWRVSLPDIQLWDPVVAALNVPLADMDSEIIQLLGTLTLMRFAYRVFTDGGGK